MNRQRGIFGLELVGSLIAYAVIAGIALGAIAGINAGLKSHYVAPERAKWDKEKATLVRDVGVYKANEATCNAANASLKKEYDGFREKKNKEADDAKIETEKADARRKARDKANAPRAQQNSMELFNMITSLGKPDGGVSCDQMDALLLEEAKRRQKFYGPAEAPAAPGTGPGLRIVEPAAPASTAAPERAKPVNPLVRPK